MKGLKSILLILLVIAAITPLATSYGDSNGNDWTHQESLGGGEYRTKAAAGAWDGSTTATISCNSNSYRTGEVSRGITTQSPGCGTSEPEHWYERFLGDPDCDGTRESPNAYWEGLSKERSWSSAVQGGSVSYTQSGANSGGGDEVMVGVAAYCTNPSVAPTLSSPSDGATTTSTSVTLQAQFNDPTGESGTIYFYNAGNNNQIGSCSASDGTTCSITWSGLSEGTYSWYTKGNDGSSTSASSSTWSFTVDPNSPANSPFNPSPGNGADPVSLSPSLSVGVSDPDGDSMDVAFYDGSGTQIGSTQTGVASGSTASVSWNNLAPGTSYSWYSVANDGSGAVYSGSFFDGWEDGSLGSWTMNSLGDSAKGLTSSPAQGSAYSGSYVVELRGDSGVLTSKSFTGKGTPKVTFQGAVWSLDSSSEYMDMDVYYDGAWHNSVVRIGQSSNSDGYKKYSYSFPSGVDVSSMKVRFASRGSGSGDYFNIDNVNIMSTSEKYSFTTVNRPNEPSNPVPASGVSSVSTSQDLKVGVSHPDGLQMDVDFYIDKNNDGTTDQSLTANNVVSGGTASVSPTLADGTQYSWYAKARTDGYSTSRRNTGEWTFTTNSAPSVKSVSKIDSSTNHAFSSVSAVVSDPDGEGDISSASLYVTDGVGSNTYSSKSIDTSYGNSNEAKVTFGPVSYADNSQWGMPDYMELEVTVTDTEGNTGSNSIKRYFPNHAPTVASGYSYSDSPQAHSFALSIDAQDVDDGSGEIASCTVDHNDGDGNSYTNKAGSLASGETATCSFTIDNSTSGYKVGEMISHRVTFQDAHGKTVTSTWASHRIPNSAPTATNLKPSGSEVSYNPTLNATYNDADGDTGSLTFYNTSSGNQIGKVTGLTPGQQASVQWDAADSTGTTYSFTVEASDGVDTSTSVVGTHKGDNIDHATVNGKTVTYQRDKYGTWIAVLNYEHYGGENPSVAPGSTFPQLPNGLTTDENVNALGTSGETRHVDQISQYGEWNVSAVRLDGYTDNHDREIHFFSTDQTVINAVTGTAVPSYTDFQGSTTQLYSDHTANLPAAAGGTTSTDTNHLFGNEFPFYNGGSNHWALAGQGNRWEMDDYPGGASKTTVHRVWVRVPNSTITEYTENFTTIHQPKAPRDPYPANQSTVDTTTRTEDEIAASVEVVHPDGRPMHVQFVNASNDQIMEIDYNVASGSRAQITNIGNKLRDKTNTTYNWYAVSKDTGTGEKTRSSLFTFDTVEVGDVMFDVVQGRNENMDITGNSNNGFREIRFEISSSQMDPIPKVTVNETSTGDLIKSWSNVANNSVLTVDLVQDGGADWKGLDTDSQYQYFIEASEGPNVLGQSLNYTIYTYNVTLDWDRAEEYYNVYQYDVYRAEDTGGDLVFNYGSGDYNLVGSLPETSFNDSGTGLRTGTFCWKVAASNPTGSSDAIPVNDGNCKTLN